MIGNPTFAAPTARRKLFILSFVVVSSSPAFAADELASSQVDVTWALRAAAPHYLPNAVDPGVDRNVSMAATSWVGYNGATGNPVASAVAETWLVPRLRLLVGFASTTQTADVRLGVLGGVQIGVLDQDHHGVNAAVGFLYRQDRFATEEGALEWSVAISRRFGRTLALASVAYAQDGEGNDREGEAHALGLHDLGAHVHVGCDARVRSLLSSTDANRAEHANPTLELAAGPLLAYTAGHYSVMAQAAWAGQRTDRLHTGAMVLGGVGAAY